MESLSNIKSFLKENFKLLLKVYTAVSIIMHSQNLILLEMFKLSIFLKFKNNYFWTWHAKYWGYFKILNMTKLNPENILLPGIGWSWGS